MKEAILNRLSKFKEHLETQNLTEDERIYYANRVSNKFNPTDITSICSIKPQDFLIACYVLAMRKEDFLQERDTIKTIDRILQDIRYKTFEEALGALKKEAHKTEGNSQISYLIGQQETTQEAMKRIIHSALFGKALTAAENLSINQQVATMLLSSTTNTDDEISPKESEAITKEVMRIKLKEELILPILNGIIFEAEKIKKENKKRKTNNSNRINLLTTIINNISNGSFTEMPKKVESMLPAEIVIELYYYLAEEQIEKAQQLDNKIQQQNDVKKENELLQLLKQFGITYSELDEETREDLLELPYETINNQLTELTTNGIPITQLSGASLKTIIQYGNKDTFSEIARWLGTGLVTKQFIIEHPEIFVTEAKEEIEALFEKAKTNSETIRPLNMDYHDEEYHPTILLSDTNSLQKKARLLEIYGLHKADTATIYNMLQNNHSFDILDLAIESGGNTKMVPKIKLSPQEFTNFKNRVAIAKNMGLIQQEDTIIAASCLLKGTKFWVTKEEAQECIPNATPYHLHPMMKSILDQDPRLDISQTEQMQEKLKQLQEFEESDISYNIHGIIISKPKVMRNLTSLENAGMTEKESLFNAMIYDSKLTLNEIETLQATILKPKQIKKAMS